MKDQNPLTVFISRARLLTLAAVLMLAVGGCRRSVPGQGSQITVVTRTGGPVEIKSSAAEFDILPSGYVQAYLLEDGKRLTLDDPDAQSAGDTIEVNGRSVAGSAFDAPRVKISDAEGKLGSRGKRVELRSVDYADGLERTVTAELHDDFPSLLVTTTAYKNLAANATQLNTVSTDRHRFSASLADPKAATYQMWSFQGSSVDWGRPDVMEISGHFSQQNPFGPPNPRGMGGGIPVVAFWTRNVGEAIGHIETLPLALSIPVETGTDGRVEASVDLAPQVNLQHGEVYSTPRTFVMVYAGDFYEPLRIYSLALQHEGWTLPKPNQQDYNVSWCGWGYESDVTPAEMLGTIPKLKEFHIQWATLDDRWFDTYGDWDPRPDTFPGDSIRKMVDAFHRQGIFVQIWWLPLGVEDSTGRYEDHTYSISRVAREHPDWLILDKDGKPAHIVRGLAALCPALPEVQQYYKQLTEKFIRDWGFDGHKLDNIYSVPPCYNPKHHHKSPYDSVKAMGDVYKVIFETTRQLKPDSITQACPCGTTPSLAWLPYLDQAVTADPVGSVQVRRRIKMYKALLGPESAVYGDHVELTRIRNPNGNEVDLGKDFASTVGTGGVVGTKFVWPNPGPHFDTVYLNPTKEALWKKWMDIYNAKMLSRGVFRNLYVYGYDVPEGYAIEKDGHMYYAFFSPDPQTPWTGTIELRGLGDGKYRVVDYENGKDMGTVEGPTGKLQGEFTAHLLLETSKE